MYFNLNNPYKTLVFKAVEDVYEIKDATHEWLRSPLYVDSKGNSYACKKDDVFIIFNNHGYTNPWLMANHERKAFWVNSNYLSALINKKYLVDVDFSECTKYPDYYHHEIIEHFFLLGVNCDKYFKKTNKKWMINQWKSLK